MEEWDVKWDWSKTGVVKKNYLEQDWSCEEELSSGYWKLHRVKSLRGLFSTLAVVLLVLEGEYWTGGSCDIVENNSNDNASEER